MSVIRPRRLPRGSSSSHGSAPGMSEGSLGADRLPRGSRGTQKKSFQKNVQNGESRFGATTQDIATLAARFVL